jgi:uroporphyrinogen-III decarboxylase
VENREADVNSKQRIETALCGGKPDLVPAFPHWWGVYKLQRMGLDPRLFPTLGGSRLAEVDIHFYETFRPDMFHLGAGASRAIRACPIEQVGKDLFLVDTHTGERRRLLEDWTIEDARAWRPALRLESRQEIDDYVAAVYPDCETVLAEGTYDHAREIAERYGDEVFIAVNIGSPICNIFGPGGPLGFENALIALHDKPALMKYLIERCYEACLEEVRAIQAVGCHGFIISEAYIAADITSPKMFREFAFDVFRQFHAEVARIGLYPIIYFMGDINPLLGMLREVGIKGLMVEESKKGFEIDVLKIKPVLGDRVCLVGNVDSVNVMLRGTPADVERAVQAQLPAARDGGFIMSTGSPLTLDTPEENVHTFMRAARVPG